MAQQKLQTFDSIISTPFITCEFGGEVFGLTNAYNKKTGTRDITAMTSLQVNKKASGAVNTYSAQLSYVVEPGADPNYLDYIISKASDRAITFSYGDMGQPEYSFIKERAIITNIAPAVNFSSNTVNYTISATSSSSLSYSVNRSYNAETNTKPSDLIFDLIYGQTDNGLFKLFSGMQNRSLVETNKWIAQNDLPVNIPLEVDINPLDRLKSLVSRMRTSDGSFFAIKIHDEPTNINGPYFEVVNSNLHQGAGDVYTLTVDIGYPGRTPVYSFVPQQNTSLALITAFQEETDLTRMININNDGSLETAGTPSLAIRNGMASSALQTWWEHMKAYPISATLITRGLVRPSILCDYLDIDVLFFGQRYNYSGKYMVLGQKDTINANGYQTELNLLRIEG